MCQSCNDKFIESYGSFSNLKEIGQIIPGLYLGYDIVSKQYLVVGGQGKPGDELFGFEKILKDPYEGLTDEEIDSLSIQDAKHEQFLSYTNGVKTLTDNTSFSIHQAQELILHAEQAGYQRSKDGDIMFWIMEKISKMVKLYEV